MDQEQKVLFELSSREFLSTGTALLVLGFLVPFYTTLVIQTLWNWFVVDALHAASISYWQALGLVMLVNLLMYRSTHNVDEEKLEERLEQTLAIVQLCVPDEKAMASAKAVKEAQIGKGGLLGLLGIFNRELDEVVRGTIALGIGWTVHTFLM